MGKSEKVGKVRANSPLEHLRLTTADWFRSVTSDYQLEPHHFRLLRLACEAWDRGQEAREAIEKNGLTFEDRFEQPRARPARRRGRDRDIAVSSR